MAAFLRLFGAPRVRFEDRWIELAPTKPVCLLIYLACHGDWIGRQELTTLLRPDVPESAARDHLRLLVYRARQLPWAASLEAEAGRLRFTAGTDVEQFRQALGRADWARAVELYENPFLNGLPELDAPGFEAWLELEREALRTTWHTAALKHSMVLEAQGEPGQAAALLKRLMQHDDLAEDVMQAYLRAAYLDGQRETALRVFEVFRERLRQELDLDPMNATLALAETIRRAEPLASTIAQAETRPNIPVSVLRPPQLVGRNHERNLLQGAVGSVVLVHGEPGVGKSRLLAEVAPDAVWLRCHEGLENLPYFPMCEWISAHVGTLGEALEALGAYRDDLARLIPEVLPGVKPPPADPQMTRLRVPEAITRLLEHVNSPVVFDDLQWADAATLELLVLLSTRGTLRLLGAYRVHEVHPELSNALTSLRSNGTLTDVRLEPLDAEAVQSLLANLIGVQAGPELFSRWLHTRSGGNPFFALQTLKTLFETRVLEANGNTWHTDLDRLTRDYAEIELPPAVMDVIRRRVSRLSGGAQRVLQAASVMREGFTPGLLAGVIHLSEWETLEGLEEAQVAGLIHDDRFNHDLFRQSVYAALPGVRRRLLHARVAKTLQGLAEPLVLAEHWFAAGNIEAAIKGWCQSAVKLEGQGLLDQAATLWQRAAAHASDPEQRHEVQSNLANTYVQAARYPEARAVLDDLLAHTTQAEVRVKAHITDAYLNFYQAQHERMRQAVHAARTVLESKAKVPATLRIDVLNLEATCAQLEGRHQEAMKLSQSLLETLPDERPTRQRLKALSTLGQSMGALGRYDEAFSVLHEVWRTAREMGVRQDQVGAATNLLINCIFRGHPEEGLEPATEALGLGEFSNSLMLRNALAAAYRRLDRLNEAIHHYEILAHDSRDLELAAGAWANLADLRSLTHQRSAANEALERALETVLGAGSLTARARVLISALNHGSDDQLGRVRARLGPVDPDLLPTYLRTELERALSRRPA
jgi:DNA-binding SARP family transcriptional activator